jgi:ectoine hydroxylase-related dioxygenase (phytanoyl-CoA dioxygenase family)
MPLSLTETTQIAKTFAQDGFVITPRLFDLSEVKEIKQEIVKVLNEVRRQAAESGKDPTKIAYNGVYVGLAARSPFFRQAVGDQRLLDVIEVILSPNVAFLSDKVVFKNKDTDYGSPWHQDWPYWRGSHKISVWVALDDANVENGCLKLLPGSHKTFVVHDGDSSDGYGFGHRLKPGAVDESKAVTAELEAGGAVFFHDLTLHSSHPNSSGSDRWVWLPTYVDAQADDPKYPWAVAYAVVRGKGRDR